MLIGKGDEHRDVLNRNDVFQVDLANVDQTRDIVSIGHEQ